VVTASPGGLGARDAGAPQAVTALAPYARLLDLRDNTEVATTSDIVAWSFESCLDNAPQGSISVPLGDAGDAGGGLDSFATVALTAAGGPGLPSDPAPLELRFGLSGPDGPVDFRWVGFTVERKVASNELVLELAGEDAYGALYSTQPAGGGRTTMTDIALVDALSGAQGTIVPIDADARNRLVSADGSIPYLAGLLTVPPGSSAWDASAVAGVTYVAVCASEVSGIPVYLDSLADTTSRAVQAIAKRAGGAVIPGDEASGIPQGSRGHLCVDPSDLALNLSQVVA
jgi:hypothetical protein